MIRGPVACIAVAATVFCPMTQLRAEDKEPFAVIELGAATERSIQEGVYSAGPSASVEFPIIKDWLEIETGISPLLRPGQTEWQADLLFKKPFTVNQHVEFMIGAGPQWSYVTAGGRTTVAAELALEADLSLQVVFVNRYGLPGLPANRRRPARSLPGRPDVEPT